LLQNEVGTDKSRAARDQNRILHACLDWLPTAAGYPSRRNPLDCNKKGRGQPRPARERYGFSLLSTAILVVRAQEEADF
jgi:hypothetical protein